MALNMRQELRMSQQLVMTPQLQQAIKLLQLSRVELVDLVHQEMLENPILEENPENAAPEVPTAGFEGPAERPVGESEGGAIAERAEPEFKEIEPKREE